MLAQMDVDYELLFVDDGSSDKTLSILRDMREQDSHCRYVSFSRNFGKEAAMYAGLREADGDYRCLWTRTFSIRPNFFQRCIRRSAGRDTTAAAEAHGKGRRPRAAKFLLPHVL